jgi:uncharacterized protein (DUF1697 family)
MKYQEALVELETHPPTAQPELTRYVALLRAINVGGHTVKMDRLRTLFQEIGLQNVETFIASGNVIFEAPAGDARALEETIEAHLHASLGYKVATFIRTSDELTEIASYEPFPAKETEVDSAVVYVAFLPGTPGEQARQKLLALRTPVDDFHVHKREIYWLCRIRMSDSTFSGGLLEKTVGLPATMRNTTTVKKLAAKYGQQ